jgi:hypothetical protein
MNEKPLAFTHPIDRLKIYEMDTSKWDALNRTQIFQIDGSTVAPYMPALSRVELAQREDRVEQLPDGRSRFFFTLTHEINELFQLFFEGVRGTFDVAFEGRTLILCCHARELQASCDEIFNNLIHSAAKEYYYEREALLWQVFEKMEAQARLEHAEAEIEAERARYVEKRKERTLLAEQNGWSVSAVIRNLNDNYREILANKFKSWAKVLDAGIIRKHQERFELELLVV